MNLYEFLLLFLLSISIKNCSAQTGIMEAPIGLINNVSFYDSKFNNSNASNGFLVTANNKIYAVTAKHILMITKTDKMNFIDFEGELKQWKMHPKNDTSAYIIIDKLLNTNRNDSLTWNYIMSNNIFEDWIAFSLIENAE